MQQKGFQKAYKFLQKNHAFFTKTITYVNCVNLNGAKKPPRPIRSYHEIRKIVILSMRRGR